MSLDLFNLAISGASLFLIVRISFYSGKIVERVNAHEKRISNLEEK